MANEGSGASPKDTTKWVFNPLMKAYLTPQAKFNADRIVTSKLNSAGQPKVTWNPASNSFVPDGPDVVIDNEGNVVVVGS